MPIVEAMRAAGWHVSVFQWENQGERKVKFDVRKSSGNSVHVMCLEESLVRKLQELLDSV
jgi:hypothetical protein